ncbi:bile acid:sodium symporter, partial [Escherichia coli]|uniref:bile acid:sodium symporter n=1 Tax=Escherichia coli TaxID=562 RepID=UPI000BD24784
IPMANILFPTSILGIMVLPLMIFHQIQLMVCAVLARRYKQQTDARLAEEKANAFRWPIFSSRPPSSASWCCR